MLNTEQQNESSLPLSFQYGKAPDEVMDREIKVTGSPRAQKLLNDYYEAKVSLDTEFTYWYTQKWIEAEGHHPMLRRSMALKCGFEHLTPMITRGELLAMQKTRYVRGAYIMPWTSNRFPLNSEEQMETESAKAATKSLEDVTIVAEGGGNVTESVGNVLSISKRFGVRREEYPVIVELCRYWKNKSVEDSSFMWAAMHPRFGQFLNMKKAVLMCSDLETSVRHGRNVVNFQYPLQIGFKGMLEKCRRKIAENTGGSPDSLAFWQGTILVIEGVQAWISNYAKEAKRMADIERDPVVKQELSEMADRLTWIIDNPPRTFLEASQLMWTCHIAVLNEIQGSGISPGRIGQVLYPFWEKDIKEGRISREETLEILECMRVKFTGIDLAMAVGTIGLLAGSTFNNVGIGGLKANGSSAENELEELIMEAAIRCSTPQPTLSMLYDSKLSDKFVLKAVECNKTGSGFPAWVNNRVAIEYLMKTFGEEKISLEDARSWTIGGCLEIQPGALVNGEIGAGSYSSTGVGFINMPKILELVLWDGVDPRTGTRVFESHGLPLDSFDQVMGQFKHYFREVVVLFEEMFNIKSASTLEVDNPIFYSALMADCIDSGLDIDRGGSRYNRCFTTWISGQVNLTNSLASIKKNVFEEQKFSLNDLKAALENNFGYQNVSETGNYSMFDQKRVTNHWARIHSQCLNAPKFGNDDPYVDDIYRDVVEYFRDIVPEVNDVFGRPWVPCMLSVTTHGPLGQACVASADGRLTGLTLADGAQSPYPGTDVSGPYAVFNSATCIDHSDFMNTQLNTKIHPSAIKGVQGSKKLQELIRAYMDKGGYHIQFNIVDSRMLKDAQENPGNYRDLMVRVAGFTQYWVELSKPIQDEIISRTEYEEI